MSTDVINELPLTSRATYDLANMCAFNWREGILYSYYRNATRPWTLCWRFWNAQFNQPCHFIDVLEMWNPSPPPPYPEQLRLLVLCYSWFLMFPKAALCVSGGAELAVMGDGCFLHNVTSSYKMQHGNPVDLASSKGNAFSTEPPRRGARKGK